MNIQTMCSVIGCTDVHTDEDYRKVQRRRQRIFLVMLALGLVTFAVAGLAVLLEWDIAVGGHSLSFYSGVGCGLVAGSLLVLVKLRATMKNKEKLREERIKFTDERVREISRRAVAMAGYALLIAVYLVGLIGGLFYPELLKVLAALAGVFLLTYVIAYYAYNRTM